MKKITVVTVSFNAEGTIENTIRSVLDQSYDDFEYLILDGKSTDQTYEIVKSYDSSFKEKGIVFRHFSSPDSGIFDAMNKAVQEAQGEWIIYMNADDSFYDQNVLKNVSSFLNEEADIVYGNTNRMLSDGCVLRKAQDIDVIYKGMPFCHQSSFTRTSLLKEYPFDLHYRVADYHFFLQMMLLHKKFVKIDVTIANYSVDGYSNKNKYKTYKSILDIKHDANLINKNSLKQKLKNIYFYFLLCDSVPFHKLIAKIDFKIFGQDRS